MSSEEENLELAARIAPNRRMAAPIRFLEPLEADEIPTVVRIGHGEDLESLMSNLR